MSLYGTHIRVVERASKRELSADGIAGEGRVELAGHNSARASFGHDLPRMKRTAVSPAKSGRRRPKSVTFFPAKLS